MNICAFYLASATTFFFLNFEKNMGQLKFDLFLRKTDVLLTPNNHFSKSIELLVSMYVLRCHAILRYIYL